MKKYLTAFILIFSSFFGISQNFQTIRNDGIYLFSDTNGNVKSIRIDSVASDGLDSVFCNFNSIRPNDLVYTCFTPYGASWMGKYIIVNPNGFNFFFNSSNDTIKINTQASLLESWKCFSYINGDYIEASVFAINYISFLGVTDSVKTINFQFKDSSGASLSHAINNYNIRLSKFHGLISTLEFFLFPDITSTFQIIGGPGMQGKKNIAYSDVFDYNIGDEFHREFYEGYFSGNYHATTKISICKIINKYNVSQDSVTYTYTRCEKDITSIGSNTQINYFNDTITSATVFANFNNLFFNHLPEETIFSNSNTEMSSLNMSFAFNNRLKKTLPISSGLYINNLGDSCWTEILFDGCWYNNSYIEGCGGPYYECYSGIDQYYNKLLYYKKGNEVWGSPLNCADILAGINNNAFQPIRQAQIFPNPVNVNSQLKIYDFTHNPFTLQIFNCLGTKVYEKNITQNETVLDLKSFSKGVYYYVLYDNIGNLTKDKIIIE